MKAFIYEKYGGPEVLQLKEVDKPVPNENELLVKVHATSVNRTDCANLRAQPFVMHFVVGFLKPKKQIGGTEFAGVIESVGSNITAFKVGDRVFGFDDQVLSSYAEYLTIDKEKAISKIPPNITFEEAAASIEGAHYAFNGLNKVKLKSGQKTLVNGASGAIGSAFVQLLKEHNVDITAVTETKNLALVKNLGASKVLDFTNSDFTKKQDTYDFIFDAVGKSSFNKCKPILNPGGVYISSELGWMCANLFYAVTTPILGRKKVIFPIPGPIKTSLNYISKLLEAEKFKPVIDTVYPFEQIPEAFQYVEKGMKTGNVVIKIQ